MKWMNQRMNEWMKESVVVVTQTDFRSYFLFCFFFGFWFFFYFVPVCSVLYLTFQFSKNTKNKSKKVRNSGMVGFFLKNK